MLTLSPGVTNLLQRVLFSLFTRSGATQPSLCPGGGTGFDAHSEVQQAVSMSA